MTKVHSCQSTPRKKEQSWRHNPSRLWTKLQSYHNQNSMVLAQKEDIWIRYMDI